MGRGGKSKSQRYAFKGMSIMLQYKEISAICRLKVWVALAASRQTKLLEEKTEGWSMSSPLNRVECNYQVRQEKMI